MKEKSIIQQVFNVYSRKIHKITELPMLNRSLEYDIQLNQLDTLIHYNLDERLDNDTFYELLKKIIPDMEQLLSLVDESITSKLLNYRDIRTLFIKYDIEPSKLSSKDKLILHELLSNNITNYLKNVIKLKKTILKLKHKDLSINQKIILSKKYIMKMLDIPKRNEYLQLFI